MSPGASETGGSEPSPADRAAIEGLHQADQAAARVHDIRTLISLWTEDGVLILPGLEPIRGREAIWEYLLGQLPEAQRYEVTEYRHDFEEIRVQGDWAWEWGTFTGRFHRKDGGPEESERARLFRILRRQPDGSWKCHRAFAQTLPAEGSGGSMK